MATAQSQCMHCRKVEKLEVDEELLEAHRKGGLVQDLFPDLTRVQCEVLIGHRSGGHHLCGDCWHLLGDD